MEASLSEARGKFKALIEYLLGEGQGTDAYRVEVRIFRDLLAIGLYRVAAWLMKKLGGNVGKAIVTETGEELPREALKSRRFITIFGERGLWRWFYPSDHSPGIFPLDQETNLPESTYSYFVQDLLGEDVAGETYDEVLGRFEKLSQKKEALVSAVYPIATQPRTADEVLREVCDKETPPKRP